MSSYPSAEQIKIWEDMEFHRERQSYQAYVNNGIPTSLEHKQWLENQGKRRKNGQQELLGGGSPERAFQTAERTETIPPGRGTSQVPLEAAHGSPQPQHKRLPDRGRRGPMRSFVHEELPRQDIRHITMLPPTCRKYPVLAIINADAGQSYISKAVICRMGLESHIKKTRCPKKLNIQGKELSTDEIFQIRWNDEGSRTTNKTEFYVAPPGLFDVMLGRDVLTCQKSEPAKRKEGKSYKGILFEQTLNDWVGNKSQNYLWRFRIDIKIWRGIVTH